MTAQVLSLDLPRISARAEIDATDMSWPAVVKTIDRLSRQVRLEAEKTFSGNRRAVIYLTYEEFVDMPEIGPVA